MVKTVTKTFKLRKGQEFRTFNTEGYNRSLLFKTINSRNN